MNLPPPKFLPYKHPSDLLATPHSAIFYWSKISRQAVRQNLCTNTPVTLPWLCEVTVDAGLWLIDQGCLEVWCFDQWKPWTCDCEKTCHRRGGVACRAFFLLASMGTDDNNRVCYFVSLNKAFFQILFPNFNGTINNRFTPQNVINLPVVKGLKRYIHKG